MRAEVTPPPLDTFIQQPALRNITFWEHVEVKFFPIEVKLTYNIYPLFIKFIFPDFINKQKINLEKDKFIKVSTNSSKLRRDAAHISAKSISDMFNSTAADDEDDDALSEKPFTITQELKNHKDSLNAEYIF